MFGLETRLWSDVQIGIDSDASYFCRSGLGTCKWTGWFLERLLEMGM